MSDALTATVLGLMTRAEKAEAERDELAKLYGIAKLDNGRQVERICQLERERDDATAAASSMNAEFTQAHEGKERAELKLSDAVDRAKVAQEERLNARLTVAHMNIAGSNCAAVAYGLRQGKDNGGVTREGLALQLEAIHARVKEAIATFDADGLPPVLAAANALHEVTADHNMHAADGGCHDDPTRRNPVSGTCEIIEAREAYAAARKGDA